MSGYIQQKITAKYTHKIRVLGRYGHIGFPVPGRVSALLSRETSQLRSGGCGAISLSEKVDYFRTSYSL